MIEVIDERKEEIKQVNFHSLETDISSEETRIVKIEETPPHLIDNDYIRRGYRINFNNFRSIIRSLFMIHNELINVWSHLIGALIVLTLVFHTAIYVKSHKDEIIELLDQKWDTFNENIVPFMPSSLKELREKYSESTEKLSDYFSELKNKTVDYFAHMDEKLNHFKHKINEQIK